MLHGWCEKCKQFKPVRARRGIGIGGVVIGKCRDCEDKERQR